MENKLLTVLLLLILSSTKFRSSGRAREAWNSRSRERHDPYREYEARRRERYSPSARRDMSPPHAKRMRRDWYVNFN